MTIDADLAAAICLLALAAVSFVDAIVLHLIRERLPFRAGSRLEHALHSARAVLFPLILVAWFTQASWTAGVTLLAVDQVVEIWDMAIERRSRSFSGGLRSSEYVVHGILLSLRGAAVAFTSVAIERGALDRVVSLLLPGAIAVAIIHVALMVVPSMLVRIREGATH
jgi:hypothetical protein